MTPTAALLLALAVPAAPGPKTAKGLPNDLIDLIPADTAGVMVIDAPKVLKSEIGQAILKVLAGEQDDDDPVKFDDLVRDAEQLVLCQFLIDKGFGDFALIVRHRDGAGLPKALMDRAVKGGKNRAPEQIGKRLVYSVKSTDFAFARIDDRTLLLVLATGNQKQVQETRQAAFGDRDPAGPAPALRKLLAEDGKDPRAVRLYGSHPTKLGLSTWLVLAAFGVQDKPFEKFDDKVVSYRGGIKEGEAAEIELRFVCKDADAAKDLLKAYEDGGGEKEPFVQDLRASAKAARDRDEVVVTAKLTRATVERLAKRPNK